MTTIILIIIAGALKAIRDVIAFWFESSRLNSAWFRRWVRTRAVFLWIPLDAWHVADMLIFLSLGMALGVDRGLVGAFVYGLGVMTLALTAKTVVYNFILPWGHIDGIRVWWGKYFGRH